MYNILFVFAGIFHTGGPLAILLYHYLRGTMRPDLWVHPFKGEFLFDYKSSPGYEVGYLLNIVYNVSVASYFSAMDTFYVGMCLFGCAHFEDVMCVIRAAGRNGRAEAIGQHMRTVIGSHWTALE